jgi:hypothetical protein
MTIRPIVDLLEISLIKSIGIPLIPPLPVTSEKGRKQELGIRSLNLNPET